MGSEEAQVARLDAAELVVVDLDPSEATRLREHARLWAHNLRDEHPSHRAKQRVEVEPLDIARELLDSVDLTAPLDFDRNRGTVTIAAEQVDRSDVGQMFAT